MSKTKPVNKYFELLDYSKDSSEMYENLVFIDDTSKSAICTDGKRLLARRDFYPELKVLSRLQETETLKFNDNTQCFEKNEKNMPMFSTIIPTQNDLSTNYKRVRFEVPNWFSNISKRAKNVYMSFVLGEKDPSIVIGSGGQNSIGISALYLKAFSGQTVDVYCGNDFNGINGYKAFLILPVDKTIDNAEWFALIMPIRNSSKGVCEYV